MNEIGNCTVIEAAASSVNGQCTFDPSDDRHKGHLATQGRISVQTVAIDSLTLAQKLRPPNLMKLDIEGAERDCLLGASETIRRFRPIIFLATHGSELHSACVDLLSRWRYGLTSINGEPIEKTDELIAHPISHG